MAATPSATAPPELPPLPDGFSPDAIDTLPVLSALLSRLQSPASNSTASTAGSPTPATPGQLTTGTSSLTIKDIPPATDSLKHKIQKARAQIKELPDIDRTAAEQEEEIKELEEKIREQTMVVEKLREMGLRARRERESRNLGDSMET